MTKDYLDKIKLRLSSIHSANLSITFKNKENFIDKKLDEIYDLLSELELNLK